MKKSSIIAIVAAGLTVGALGMGVPSASAGDRNDKGAAAPKPPKGARAVVQVSPNPTTERGQEVTITGHCGGGPRLKAIIAGLPGKSIMEDIRIIDDNPKGFVAKARLKSTIGNGVGPIFVDCDGEMGVTLLVTHV
ncbi:hypothetical protein AB0I81_45120 [Nonomuraea sp. NPDC050404]|uniref:hypothetical protein n=1 Tax=Nonomuraea sp. NPDC050404 TaxID=3155783 RepID=UPI00340A9E37